MPTIVLTLTDTPNGGGGGNFHHLRVLRDAPSQMEITA